MRLLSGRRLVRQALKTAKIGGATVLTNAKGFTLYWFAPDTATKSNCNGSCATYWPPVKGPATAGAGVTGKLGTITRSDGSAQATYNGHPLYTYVSDTAPGQAKGNGLNVSGGVWHEVTVSGAAAPAASPAPRRSPAGAGAPRVDAEGDRVVWTDRGGRGWGGRSGSACGWPGPGCWPLPAGSTLTCT